MAFYKYTVANSEGKRLSGTVEAPDEATARKELNNLGFSILVLEEAAHPPEVRQHLTRFIFEAIDKNSKTITGTIPAASAQVALEKLEREYSLTILGLWKEGASPAEIEEAKTQGKNRLQSQLREASFEDKEEFKDLDQQKEETLLRAKIEHILTEVHALLAQFDALFSAGQKTEIHKKIDKLLRVKHSNNLEYILACAEDVLKTIQGEESALREKGMKDKQIELRIATKNMLQELHTTTRPKTLREDIAWNIEKWQERHREAILQNPFLQMINTIFTKIHQYCMVPAEILALRAQIHSYNKQMIEFIRLYFKEPTAEYKTKVKNALKTVWNTRKNAKLRLKELKRAHTHPQTELSSRPRIGLSLLNELNELTGWLLVLYIAYYIVALLITTKDFGLTEIPRAFYIYNTHLFKYLLTIIFLLHAATALKLNFFRNSIIANLILFPLMIFGSIVAVLNF